MDLHVGCAVTSPPVEAQTRAPGLVEIAASWLFQAKRKGISCVGHCSELVSILRLADGFARPQLQRNADLSAPKKGKDLSALKARLAKKAAAGEGEDGADMPSPGEAAAEIPSPGEVARPAADIPAPGEVRKPIDIPAPGEVYVPPPPAPAPAPVPVAARPKELGDDPMSGGAAFNPDHGLIDDHVGDIKSKSGIGLPIFAGVIGILVGAGLGWMAHKTTDLNARKDAAVKKAEVIQAKVTEIEESRSRVALRVGEAKDALEAKEGDKAVEVLAELEPTYTELGDLFGWQMASMNAEVVKAIFELAEANNLLQLEVGIMKGWIAANKDILASRVQGPASFVVIASPQGGAILSEYVSGICDELPEELPPDFNPDTLKKCEGEEILNAKGYMVRTEIGGEISMVPAGQGFFLNPAGPMYMYAIGTNPEANAKAYFDIRMGQLLGIMDSMVKLKDDALAGISSYTGDPVVSGD